MENRQDKKDHQTTYTWPHTAEHIHRSNSHQTRHRQDSLVVRFWCGGVNWVGQTVVRASGRLNSHQTRQDRHACLSTAAALAARPPTRSDVVRHAKCKHAVDCCLRLSVKFSTKRHATMVIGHLSVQTLPDGLQTRSRSQRLIRRRQDCRVWRAVWIAHCVTTDAALRATSRRCPPQHSAMYRTTSHSLAYVYKTTRGTAARCSRCEWA